MELFFPPLNLLAHPLFDVVKTDFFISPHKRWQTQVFFILNDLWDFEGQFDGISSFLRCGFTEEDGSLIFVDLLA